MKTRLAIFVAAILLLPFAGLLLSGNSWETLQSLAPEAAGALPALLAALLLSAYVGLINKLTQLRGGINLITQQRSYFAFLALASCALGWLLGYLDHYAGSWLTPDTSLLPTLLADSWLFATLMPAVLGTRALLATFPGLLRRLGKGPSLAGANPGSAAAWLLLVAVIGLMGGAAWPDHLYWLMWISPLPLMIALQLMWSESTIFSGIRYGDWGRVALAALSGLLVGCLALLIYEAAGGRLLVHLYELQCCEIAGVPLAAFFGFALFGLICLQLGDVLAENWRGKKRSELIKKKPFPIPVVVKRD